MVCIYSFFVSFALSVCRESCGLQQCGIIGGKELGFHQEGEMDPQLPVAHTSLAAASSHANVHCCFVACLLCWNCTGLCAQVETAFYGLSSVSKAHAPNFSKGSNLVAAITAAANYN